MPDAITGPLRIVGLSARNVMRLTAVDIEPLGEAVVRITGANGAGKTSVLTSIWLALDPASAGDVSRPIHEGAETARIKLDLGEIIVERSFTRRDDGGHNMQIKVTAADGSRFAKPQALLDSLMSKLTVDPGRFLRARPDEQFEMVQGLMPDVDFAAVEDANQRDYDDRREVNRIAKAARTEAEAISVPDDTPEERIDTDAIASELAQVGEHNADIERRKMNREALAMQAEREREQAEQKRVDASALRQRIKDIEAEIEALTSAATSLDEAAEAKDAKLEAAGPLPEPKNASAVQAKLQRAQIVNRHVDARSRKQELLAKARDAETRSQDLTDAMEQRLAGLRRQVAAANLPVDGLQIVGRTVMLNGQPLGQASTAERVRASMAIAMAMKPALRVIKIADGGNDLDQKSMAIVQEMAQQHGYQVWIELVDHGGDPVGFVIEDGHLAKTITTADGTVADAETGEVISEPTDTEIGDQQ